MLNIVKIGGNVINDPVKLNEFLTVFASIEGPKILVHGGGREATELSGRLGIETKMIDGRRVTDEATLDVVTMVYAGLVNKRIVARLQDKDCNALGLTGADGALIPASRRPAQPVDYGFVGDIDPEKINTDTLITLISLGLTPVFSAICWQPGGSLLNCNADSVASALAVACASKTPVRLIYCFEKPGVMTDVNNDSSLISLITPSIFYQLVEEGKISGGMLPKVSNALAAVEKGVAEVRICDAANLLSSSGTTVKK